MTRAIKACNKKWQKKKQARIVQARLDKIWQVYEEEQEEWLKQKEEQDTDEIKIITEIIYLEEEPVASSSSSSENKTASEIDDQQCRFSNFLQTLRKKLNKKKRAPKKTKGCGECGKCKICVHYYGKEEYLEAKALKIKELIETNPENISKADLKLQLAIWKKFNQLLK